ncbi:prolipoprotein diacylglyceryl transferase [Pseudoroseicyclus tamaricis]|uniref:Phosphatidylglycerol--prolipoprotein diacylglyceryl transferase n=1 Tax=Pseudoroseicyclus tamaricis TaxID=2705421 RepID=A0A6B2JZC1_9RHOB|nr:prolipoprotein diacylglyceryl transferase [Pseudoroseicyclus tamaricis]NDV01989.1 prolipoprotein diacylglyceryl transferase [Pseudoroseicyclus tamaricis]
MNGIPFPDISPEIFSLELGGFTFALRWYALAYIVGMVIGWRVCVAALRRPRLWAGDPPMEPEATESLLTAIVLGVIGGGRLGYVLFYQPAYYLAHPLEIIRIWDGGMSFHGGFLGVVVALVWFSRRHKVHLGPVGDMVAMVAPISILLVRCANFINNELWGRPTDLPWGVIFPGAAAQDCGDMLTLCARHPSQLYEAGLEGLLLGAILLLGGFRWGWLKQRWKIFSVLLIGYGASRFLLEFVRQPDAQFVSPGNPLGLALQVNGWGLTMGQLLSLPMILFGLWLLSYSRRRAAPA